MENLPKAITEEALIAYISALSQQEKQDLYFETLAQKHSPLKDAILNFFENEECQDSDELI